MRFFKRLRINGRLLLVILLTLLALYIDIPRLPLEATIAGKTYQFTLDHPRIQFSDIKRDLEPRLGLDLQGGTQVTLEADMSKIPAGQRADALELTRNVIERRVNLYGVSEPVIQTAKNGDTYRIIVELAGVKDINQAIDLIGQTAKLEFGEVVEATGSATASAAQPPMIPTGLNGGDIEKAEVIFDPQTGQPQVGFTVRKESQDKFYKTTGQLMGKQMAIILDGVPISAPVVQAAIRDNGQIQGQFDTKSARQLALQLNAGALKAPVKIVSQKNVGATLGNESIHKSIIAGLIGFAIIAAFMIANYGKLGLMADIALVVYALVTYAIFKIIPVTLTLAGIAGFILSIGMAVDANILIFERMKEEIRWGKDHKTALRLGFERAMSSIKASNISTLITTLILYWFGTGLVRGFALTLAIGVIVSMFSAIFVTRTLLKIFYKV